MFFFRLLRLRGCLTSTPNLSTSSSASMFKLYFTTCATVFMCLTVCVNCLDPETKDTNNFKDMAENKETTYTPEDDYVDLMRTEGFIVEEEPEDEYVRSGREGFYYFRNVQQHLISQDFPDWNLAEIERELVEIWNNADDETQLEYINYAAAELEREREQIYTQPQSENETGKGIKRKCKKDPNAPKKPLSAFFWFTNDMRAKVKSSNPEYGVGDIAKELGKLWYDAEPETKSKYEAIAEEDKARYEKEINEYNKKWKDDDTMLDNEMNCHGEMAVEVQHSSDAGIQNYTPTTSDNKIGRDLKRVYNEDPTAPKRPLSAYSWWSSDDRGKVKELHPEYTEEDIVKELDKRWIATDAATKSKYEAKAAEDVARYKREMNEYKKKWKRDAVSISIPPIIIRDYRKKDVEEKDNAKSDK